MPPDANENQNDSNNSDSSDDNSTVCFEMNREDPNDDATPTTKDIIDLTNKDNIKQQKNDNKNNNETASEKCNVSSEENMKLPPITEELESHLTCPICHSLYHVPVLITTCQHTFCSECIRTSMRTSRINTQRCICPLCRVNTDEKHIVPCTNLEHIVRLYKQGIKDVLLEKELKIDLTRSHSASEEAARVQCFKEEEEREKIQGETKSEIPCSVTVTTRSANLKAAHHENKKNNPLMRQSPPTSSRKIPSSISSSSSITGPWSCPLCTFANTTRVWTNAHCEICDEKRPGPVKKQKRVEEVDDD